MRLGGQWGFVNEAGQEVVPCRYDEVRDFTEGWPGRRRCGEGVQWGFVNKAGREVVPCRYDEVRDFDC